MAIDTSHSELFENGTLFKKTQFLDNFYEIIEIDELGESKLSDFLLLIIKKSSESSIKRSAYKIIAELSLAGKISNSYIVLSITQDFLNHTDPCLQVIALKYLQYYYSELNSTILDKIIELSDNSNGDVASQALYLLGIGKAIAIYDDSSITQLVLNLNEALRFFEASTQSIENRTDADFFISFINWIIGVLGKDIERIKELFVDLEKHFLRHDLYRISEVDSAMEYRVFQLVTALKRTIDHAANSDIWLEIRPNIEILMHLRMDRFSYLNDDKHNSKIVKQINSKLLNRLEDSIFSTNLINEKRRLEALRSGSEDNELIDFINYLIALYPQSEKTVSDNIQLLATLSSHFGSEKGLSIYDSIKSTGFSAEEIVQQIILEENINPKPFKTGSFQGEEVLKSLMYQIDGFLPHYPPIQRHAFMNVLEEIIRYVKISLVNNDKKRFKFLFSEVQGGKGQKAVEQDLQDSMLLFFEHSSIADGLEHEKTKFVDGGRVDIVYKKDFITIPIELKKTLEQPNVEILEKNYIAQAQTYTAGYDQLGIFVILELSDKSKVAPPNFKDWFHIHHLKPSTLLDIKYPDYIVSVIIPANRTSPSSKSNYG